jgi:hypothetical protein
VSELLRNIFCSTDIGVRAIRESYRWMSFASKQTLRKPFRTSCREISFVYFVIGYCSPVRGFRKSSHCLGDPFVPSQSIHALGVSESFGSCVLHRIGLRYVLFILQGKKTGRRLLRTGSDIIFSIKFLCTDTFQGIFPSDVVHRAFVRQFSKYTGTACPLCRGEHHSKGFDARIF